MTPKTIRKLDEMAKEIGTTRERLEKMILLVISRDDGLQDKLIETIKKKEEIK